MARERVSKRWKGNVLSPQSESFFAGWQAPRTPDLPPQRPWLYFIILLQPCPSRMRVCLYLFVCLYLYMSVCAMHVLLWSFFLLHMCLFVVGHMHTSLDLICFSLAVKPSSHGNKTGKTLLVYNRIYFIFKICLCVCVLGESGLGKSTLINSLFLTDLYSKDYPGPSQRIKKTVQVK